MPGTHFLLMCIITQNSGNIGYSSTVHARYTILDFLCFTVVIAHRSTIWSSSLVQIHVFLALWSAGVLLECVSYILVKLKIPIISLEAEPSTYLRKSTVCQFYTINPQPCCFTTS